ncbi:hypothetical protein KY359_02520 [Candidatus Woesearchaeota archaeon]|nr:hypothetical protein [Candidatus Woesearchaeota archaeon]
MTVHHIIRESDQKHACPYCGRSTESRRWKSSFATSNFHYKTHQCECGRNVTIKMSFMGSGHDSWTKDLDMRIEEVDSESQKKKPEG